MFGCPKKFISTKDEAVIVEAIAKAELQTSGEIRIHIENNAVEDSYARALHLFAKLKMHETAARNGVLIYVNPKHKKVAIIGDQGINEVVVAEFWKEIVADIISAFAQGHYVKGLTNGVERVGNVLKGFFAYQNDDKDELPNTISR